MHPTIVYSLTVSSSADDTDCL